MTDRLRDADYQPLPGERLANQVYDILVAHAGASEDGRDYFVSLQERDGLLPEFRFQGSLGFGGKVRHDRGRIWVDAYPEDLEGRPDRVRAIEITNRELLEAHLKPTEES